MLMRIRYPSWAEVNCVPEIPLSIDPKGHWVTPLDTDV